MDDVAWLLRRRDRLERRLEDGSRYSDDDGGYELWRWDCDRLVEVVAELEALGVGDQDSTIGDLRMAYGQAG